jgi:hypothetical protein
MYIRDLRGNRIIQLSATTFANFSANIAISPQENSLACYPYGTPLPADAAQCVSDTIATSQQCTGNHF